MYGKENSMLSAQDLYTVYSEARGWKRSNGEEAQRDLKDCPADCQIAWKAVSEHVSSSFHDIGKLDMTETANLILHLSTHLKNLKQQQTTTNSQELPGLTHY